MPMPRVLRWYYTPWVILAAVALVAIQWFVMSRFVYHADHEPRRWNSVVIPEPSQTFRDLLTPQDVAAGSIVWADPHVSVYSLPNTKPPHLHPTIRDLADSGQAHAIDFLAGHFADAARSWTALQEALIDPTELSPGEKDPFVFERTLVATVTKGAYWNPGDRMMWTRTFVQPINFQFAGYTVAATENETVKVSSIEATSSRKFSTDIGLTIPGLEGPKASAGSSSEKTEKTTADINAQYEKLGVDIKRDFLRIVRESETGGDVLGNTTVTLSAATDPSSIQRLVPNGDDKKPLGEDLVLLVIDVNLDDGASQLEKDKPPINVLPQAPVPHCPLIANVWMLYEHRRVDYGADSYDEAHQNVSLLRDGEVKRTVEIVAADDVSPAVWSIRIVDAAGKENPNDVTLVGAHVDNGQARELVFTDYGRATKLVHWLRTNYGKGLQSLTFDYPKDVSLVPVKNSRNDCQPGDKSNINRHIYQKPS